MRLLLLISVFWFAITSQPALAQEAERSCAADSPYHQIHKQNLANLQWALFSLSEARHVESAKAHLDPSLLRRLTNASVSALANIYGLRAQFIQVCDMDPEDYYRKIAANGRFIAIFSATTSAQSFPAVSHIHNSNRPVDYALDPVIREQLSLWSEHKGWSANDARKVAAAELLGKPVKWDEGHLVHVDDIKLNPDGSRLAEVRPSRVSETLMELRMPVADRPDWRRDLETLSNYYVPIQEHQ